MYLKLRQNEDEQQFLQLERLQLRLHLVKRRLIDDQDLVGIRFQRQTILR